MTKTKSLSHLLEDFKLVLRSSRRLHTSGFKAKHLLL